jgi:hypothetical protein
MRLTRLGSEVARGFHPVLPSARHCGDQNTTFQSRSMLTTVMP